MDSAQSRSQPETICQTSRECLQTFDSWSSSDNNYVKGVIAANARRFRSWTAYLGVFAQESVSLDTRLKQQPETRLLVMMLLEVLQTDLCVLNTFGRDISLPLSVGSASSHELERSRETFASENNPAIGEVLGACRGVIGSIDRLHRLGSRIRVSSKNPNDGSLEERVLSFSRTLESDGFETTIRLILDFKFPDARKGLIDKLTKSIVFRRNRLLYERNHQHKLDEDRQHRQAGETGPSGSVIGNVETGDQNAPINENHVVGNTSQPINRASPSDMVSATDHTPFSEEKFKKHVEEEPAYTTRSGGSSWVGRIVYPMPPTVEEDASHVRCQFCFRELSREDLQEPRFWEKHVDGDLQQYVCVSENCRRPLYFFNSEDAWRRHMELDHQFDWPQLVYSEVHEWRCILDAEHDERFRHLGGIQEHLRLHHSGDLSSVDIDLVARNSIVPNRRDVGKCLLCQISIGTTQHTIEPSEETVASPAQYTVKWNLPDVADENSEPQTPVDPNSSERAKLKKMSTHIGNHLKALSFLSLRGVQPEEVGLSEMGSSRQSEAAELSSRESSIHSFGLGFEDIEQDEVPILEEPVSWTAVLSQVKEPDPSFNVVLPRDARRRRFELQRQLRSACQEIKNPMSTASKARFLPKKQLYNIINKDSVISELMERNAGRIEDFNVEEVAEAVCKDDFVEISGGKRKRRSYRQVFAILAFLGQSQSIRLFIRDCVSDLDLPLVDREDPEFEGENALYRTDSAGESQGQPLICAEDWSDESRRQFCEYQWMLLAPFFHRSTYNNVNHYALRDRHLLPFVEEEDSESAGTSGNDVQDVERRDTVVAGFSQVYMVRIHPEHHDFHGLELDPERGFAIKQLRDWDTDTRERFTKEVDMLKKFTGDGAHPHVVSLLATYEQFGLFHLIFHRADGDLFQYWKFICPNPTFDSRTVLWVAKQLAGLASGLLRFHRHLTTPKIYADEDSYRRSGKRAYLPTEKSETRYGRHGDLKPENMLWFPGKDKDACGGGVLKITDFGQAEFHSKDSKTYRQSKGVDTLTYRPPEGEIFPRTIRQSSDIWSLGCIYLEFVTWMLGGADDLQKFKTSRLSYDSRLRMNSDTFFECVQLEDHEGAQLKPAVSRHIDSLAARRNCSQYFKDVLNLIRDMLVVESNDKDLIRRKSCGEVHMFLKEAYEKCLSSEDYATDLIWKSS